MPGRANALIVIPVSFWSRDETKAALTSHDIGRLFALLHQYAGASQTQIGMACGMNQGKVSRIARGIAQVESLAVFERIADGLSMPDSARLILGLAPRATPRLSTADRSPAPIPAGDTGPSTDTARVSDLLGLSPADGQEEDPLRRRTFIGNTAATLFGTIVADQPSATSPADPGSLAPILTGPAPRPIPADETLPDLAALDRAVNDTRSRYQQCRYADLISTLPGLLAQLHTACLTLDGNDRLHASALSADAHHVAAGLLLKLDDQGLAYLAADRSMRAAQASEDPVTVGASARIITHTLMAGGHLPAAIQVASTQAERLDHDVPSHTPDSLSIYGALLLRGAVAAAKSGNRGTAYDLLGEADEAGKRLGRDANIRWTAFGPTNAKLHRVDIAVTLGDAGTAIDVARHVDLSTIAVTERRATLLIDTARAFLQWGKYDKAYLALRAAEDTAHEEVTGRPAVHRIVRELVTAAPPTIKRDAQQFARQIGVQP